MEFVGSMEFGVGEEAIVAVFAFVLLPQPVAVSGAQPVIALGKDFATASVMEVVAPPANDSVNPSDRGGAALPSAPVVEFFAHFVPQGLL